jgi:hypothetical protein
MFLILIFLLGDSRPVEGEIIGNETMITDLPEVTFVVELDRYLKASGYCTGHHYRQSRDRGSDWRQSAEIVTSARTDTDEMHIALAEMGFPQEERTEIATKYREIRDILQRYGLLMHSFSADYTGDDFEAAWKEQFRNIDGADLENYPPLDELEVPEGLPVEFKLYLLGTIEYYRGEWCFAQEYWERLLELPYEERRYRSTWAAYMTGRTALEVDREYALRRLNETRQLHDMGFPDILGLAADTYRIEGRMYLDDKNYVDAIEKYIDYFASGNFSSWRSISRSIYGMFGSGINARRLAASKPVVRDVVTIWLSAEVLPEDCSRGVICQQDTLEDWLEAIEAVGVEDDIATAEYLAWALYDTGRFDLAERWLEHSSDSGLALWLRAKFAIRAGNLERAADLLDEAALDFPPFEHWKLSMRYYNMSDLDWDRYREDDYWYRPSMFPYRRLLAERGMLFLVLGRYEDSLDSLIHSAYLDDIAYLAEKVLTVDELKSYVDENWPDPGPDVDLPTNGWQYWRFMIDGDAERACIIRYYLAQRLARLGRSNEAIGYYPPTLRAAYQSYLDYIHEGNDTRLSNDVRADALWEAANIMRHQGLELVGAQLNPDFAISGGSYYNGHISGLRDDPSQYPLFPSSQDEIDRIQRSIGEIEPYKSLHYRYIACDIAWEACELMPDESEDTVYRLCIAGGWLKARDPEAADRFYKAMVNRGRSTWLGQEADQLRWFPDCDSEEPEEVPVEVPSEVAEESTGEELPYDPSEGFSDLLELN